MQPRFAFRPRALAIGAAALAAVMCQPASGQSNATGIIYGTVEAHQGATIVARQLVTNLQRRVSPDAAGRYLLAALPVGRYQVDVLQQGAVVHSALVDVVLGQGVDAGAPAHALSSVRVHGMRQAIDVSSTTHGALFLASELERLPLRPGFDAIIQLAPSTTRADDRYLGASFGGSGASENAYYIDGFPVTNPLNGLGSSELPFGAIAQAQILTSGFGAEFGRSIGGVVNIITKSGGNRWEGGAQASVEPASARARYRDLYYADTGFYGNPETVNGIPRTGHTDGQLLQRRADNTRRDVRAGVYLGGPLIRDKLFLFVALDQLKTARDQVARPTNAGDNALGKWGFGELRDTVRRHLARLDWNINERNRMELLAVGDNSVLDATYYGYDYGTRARGATVNSSEHYRNDPANTQGVGADFYQLKLISNLGDAATLTAMHGKLTSRHANVFGGYDVFNPASAVPQISALSVCPPSLPCMNNQPLPLYIMPRAGRDTVVNSRLDLQWQLGAHSVRIGADHVRLDNENTGNLLAGGSLWRYGRQANPTIASVLGGTNARVAVASVGTGPYAALGYWARQTVFSSETDVYSRQSAQYIEDRWQATRNLVLSLGVRNEQFKNINSDGDVFLHMRNQVAPRLGAAWDVRGDATLKLFATAGRYFLQAPGGIAVRGAGRSTLTNQAFSYTGIDQNGAPTGLQALSAPFSANNEYGQYKDPKVLSAVGLKPNFQDELSAGFEHAASAALHYGAKATYRRLKSSLDDLCDARPVLAYFVAHPELDTTNYGGFGCATFNPGQANTFLVDLNSRNPALAGTAYAAIALTAEQFGMPPARRSYQALDLFAEHPLRNGWYGRVNYTWSRSAGNTEGMTRSDNGVSSPGATLNWDRREITELADGLLPNDRTHQLKAYGHVTVQRDFTLGANLLLASGRPKSCFGNHPSVPLAYDIGSAYFYCGGGSNDANNAPSPRGSRGRFPTDARLDLSAIYRPLQAPGLALRMDLFNAFNRQAAQRFNDAYNNGPDAVNPEFDRITSLTAPRALRLSAGYALKF